VKAGNKTRKLGQKKIQINQMNKRVSGRQFFQMGQMKSGEKEGHQKGPTPDKRIHTC